MSVAYYVDPSLPTVKADDIACPGCGQNLNRWALIPSRHYRDGRPSSKACAQPTAVLALCSFTDDDLMTVIYRAQRHAAGLGAPRLVAS